MSKRINKCLSGRGRRRKKDIIGLTKIITSKKMLAMTGRKKINLRNLALGKN